MICFLRINQYKEEYRPFRYNLFLSTANYPNSASFSEAINEVESYQARRNADGALLIFLDKRVRISYYSTMIAVRFRIAICFAYKKSNGIAGRV